MAPAWALRETSLTPALASSMAAAVSWVLVFTRFVMDATSVMPAVTSSDAALMSSALARRAPEVSRMVVTEFETASMVLLMDSTSSLTSPSEDLTVIRVERSPLPICRMLSQTTWMGAAMLPLNQIEAPITRTARMATAISMEVLRA